MDDDTLAAVHDAVARHIGGDRAGARAQLDALWARVGPDGDPLHRCAIAHHLADVQDAPDAALAWDLLALDAAGAVDDARARRLHASLSARALLPSLHLNLAEDYRLLGRFDDARAHLRLGEDALARLDGDGDQGVRAALDGLRERLAACGEARGR